MIDAEVEARARLSHGASGVAIYDLVQAALNECGISAGTLLDVGCGNGGLFQRVRHRVGRYIGLDIVRYDGFPDGAEFVASNLEGSRLPFDDASLEVVACIETVEHVENPRALMRELARLVKPGGWVLVSTPNQLSLASKLCLLTKDEFLHFQERPGLYPAHISALLEVDLRRMARETGLSNLDVLYSGQGRIPLSERHWPSALAGRRGRRGSLFSDNVLLMAQKPL
jgi:2-polyprenyl-3-methyl-5-hydroxy-6-metoxy-1,4-benzoquinol methylase